MPRSITERIVECRTPHGAKFRLERWYYDAIRKALLDILPEPGISAEMFELQKRVFEHMDVVTRENIECLSWLVAWVRLDLEAEGVLTRDAAMVTRL